jgi:ribosome maturation factor RimP
VLNTSDFWNLVESVVRSEGLMLFDIEVPSAQAGVVRIYIAQPSGEKQNVGIDDCARVSKALSRRDEFESSFPENCVLEVSSPGINRKLSRPEHFAGAIGERVRLTVTQYRGHKHKGEGEDDAESKDEKISAGKSRKAGKVTLRGELLSFSAGELQVADETLKETVSIALPDVQEARVDFQFNKK